MKALTWIAVLAWASFLYFGVKSTAHSVTSCSTNHSLPQNHLLGTSDVDCKDSNATWLYAGLYLKRAVSKDNALQPGDVSREPLLLRTLGTSLFVLNMASYNAGTIDAGQVLDIGTSKTIIASQNRLIAVSCQPRTAGGCEAIFEVQESKLKALVEATDPLVIVETAKSATQQDSSPVSNGTTIKAQK